MPFNSGFYNRTNVTHFNASIINTGLLNVVVTPTIVTSGIDLDVTITNLTSGNQSGIIFNFDIGWGNSGVEPMPTHVWLADPSWNRDPIPTYNEVRANYYGASNFTATGAGAINRGLWSPCMVFEHSGGRAIGISTNYPAGCRMRTSMSGTSLYLFLQGWIPGDNPVYGTLIPQDFFASGETMNFKVWMRETSGSILTTGTSLNLCQPYVDWARATFPNMRNAIKSPGRIYGSFIALGVVGNSGNPRYYGRFGSGLDVLPWAESTNWYQIFDTFPKPHELKSKGFGGIMFWNPAGHQPNTDFPSASFEDLPSHLKARTWQISDWGRRNNLKVYNYHAGTWLFFQPNGRWDEVQRYNFITNSGFLGTNYTFGQLVKPTFNPTGYQRIKNNTTNGWLTCTDGMGMDAMGSVLTFPWITGALVEMRQRHPSAMIFSESFADDRTSFYCLSCYYPYNQWDGIKCELANRLYGENDAFIVINQFDYPNPTTASGRAEFVSGVYAAEQAGITPIILCDMTAFNLLAPPSVSNNSFKLDKLENRTSRRIR